MKIGNIETRAALAKAVGRSAMCITKWLRLPDWRWGGPPWSPEAVDEIQQWSADRGTARQAASAAMTEAQTRLLVTRQAKIELQRQILAGGYLKRTAVESKQKRQAEHIEEGYEKRGVSEKEAEGRAWATVNKMTGGGKKSESGRGTPVNKAPAKKGGRLGGAASASRFRRRAFRIREKRRGHPQEKRCQS